MPSCSMGNSRKFSSAAAAGFAPATFGAARSTGELPKCLPSIAVGLGGFRNAASERTFGAAAPHALERLIKDISLRPRFVKAALSAGMSALLLFNSSANGAPSDTAEVEELAAVEVAGPFVYPWSLAFLPSCALSRADRLKGSNSR